WEPRTSGRLPPEWSRDGDAYGIVDLRQRGGPVALRVDDDQGFDRGKQPVHDPFPLAIQLDDSPFPGQATAARPCACRYERVVARRLWLAALGVAPPDRARDVTRSEIDEERCRRGEARGDIGKYGLDDGERCAVGEVRHHRVLQECALDDGRA